MWALECWHSANKFKEETVLKVAKFPKLDQLPGGVVTKDW